VRIGDLGPPYRFLVPGEEAAAASRPRGHDPRRAGPPGAPRPPEGSRASSSSSSKRAPEAAHHDPASGIDHGGRPRRRRGKIVIRGGVAAESSYRAARDRRAPGEREPEPRDVPASSPTRAGALRGHGDLPRSRERVERYHLRVLRRAAPARALGGPFVSDTQRLNAALGLPEWRFSGGARGRRACVRRDMHDLGSRSSGKESPQWVRARSRRSSALASPARSGGCVARAPLAGRERGPGSSIARVRAAMASSGSRSRLELGQVAPRLDRV